MAYLDSESPFIVFSQDESDHVPIGRLAAQARAHFRGEIEILEAESQPSGGPLGAAELSADAAGIRCVFSVTPRPTTPEDLVRARDAEERGRRAGMTDLAARCRTVWLVVPNGAVAEWILCQLLALLASVALGPILPPDGSTLLGVRSARERAERLRAAAEP